MKDIIEGMFDWDRRVNQINMVVTPISSGFLLLLDYFHLIPQNNSVLQFALLLLYVFLYASLFTTVALWYLKRQSKKNLDTLHEDIAKLKTSK